MGKYNTKIFPRIMGKNLAQEEITKLRRNVLKDVTGDILEIGHGTGVGSVCYPENVKRITAIDIVDIRRVEVPFEVNYQIMSVEKMTFENQSFDTVVSMFTLCSVKNLEEALGEIKRVLKPGGKVIFIEHGKSNKEFAACVQEITNPLFNILGCGCNVNRDFEKIFIENGFELEQFERTIFRKRPITSSLYTGQAKPI